MFCLILWCLSTELPDYLGQIICHIGIVVLFGPQAVCVVAHVDGNNLPFIGQTPGDDAPVPGRAVKPMRDKKRWVFGGFAMYNRVQHDRVIPAVI